jgi:hypothetical protein
MVWLAIGIVPTSKMPADLIRGRRNQTNPALRSEAIRAVVSSPFDRANNGAQLCGIQGPVEPALTSHERRWPVVRADHIPLWSKLRTFVEVP